MNIFITGSNGFVGSQLMSTLEKSGHKVIGIDISDHCNSTKHANTLSGDIRKKADLDRVYARFSKQYGSDIELIIHCAAAKHDFGIKREEYFSHNKLGTKILLDFAAEHKINRFINLSTVSVFGHPKGRSDEDTAYNPDHPYGESKLAGELLSIEWQKQDEARELIVLRPTVIYGPHNFANVYNLIDILHRRPILTVGKGDHIKSIVSLGTILGMISFSLTLLKPGYQHYNCVDEPYITLRELMQIVAANPGFKMPKITIPLGLAIGIGMIFDVPAKLFSIDLPINSDRMRKFATATYFTAGKIRKAGYVQTQSIQDSVSEMCSWYMNQDQR
ncbi:MAG: NAD(P)-dependent oxidoreductase [Candidatus Cloacimonadaceae bacterium]|jgi:nucleoside-diphosphate-sugar epimerase|nr:NAD(P)-dependent oxidoreductase [Candidatus Cloacimonadota bacterium]MDY0127826.1 NAD(P)-dependent oxidoreductase [Candidatus Cloacimonadaceae bacterium]MCB5254848.1 NAD(P)-dependent oxidoreductase [Candidatus Cloacimonadota bacterium]MCK9177905.1 NAD(P)-dependent oxidoreductase [Candidatus Cloacimonadota bacterium]MCK9242949.1 NAD(P)-dependent oxidoreductase [Candidatus Cloacimonadota bacterium]